MRGSVGSKWGGGGSIVTKWLLYRVHNETVLNPFTFQKGSRLETVERPTPHPHLDPFEALIWTFEHKSAVTCSEYVYVYT
jgi:hypothetical protein